MGFVRNTLVSGAISAVTTTAAAALLGKRHGQNPAAPINAISHIPFGEKAARQDKPSLKYTATGALLNSMAVTGWAALLQLLVARKKPSAAQSLAAGAAVSAAAYVTDYHVVPKRLTPGFEERLTKKDLGTIYAVLAVSLAIGALVKSRQTDILKR